MQFKSLPSSLSTIDSTWPAALQEAWHIRQKVYGAALRPFVVLSGSSPIAWFFLYETKMAGHKLLMDPPFLGSAFQVSTESAKIESHQTRLKQILRCIAEGLKYHFRSYLVNFALPPEVKDLQPFLWAGFRERVRYTYLADLQLSEQELLKAMSAGRRKNIRDAQKQNFQISMNTAFPQVISLVERSFNRQRHSWSKWVLQNLLEQAENISGLKTVLVSSGTTDLAAAVFLREGRKARYLFGGFNAAAGHHTAGPMAMWTGMLELKAAGVEVFDFDGSMVPDIERYFRGFGGTLHPYFTLSLAGTWYGRFIRCYKS